MTERQRIRINCSSLQAMASGVAVVLLSTRHASRAIAPPPELVDLCTAFVGLADRLDTLARVKG